MRLLLLSLLRVSCCVHAFPDATVAASSEFALGAEAMGQLSRNNKEERPKYYVRSKASRVRSCNEVPATACVSWRW